MKYINWNTNNLNTIKMALFVASNIKALKGSPIYYKINELLNSLTPYDNDDIIIITNADTEKINIIIEEKEEIK